MKENLPKAHEKMMEKNIQLQHNWSFGMDFDSVPSEPLLSIESWLFHRDAYSGLA